MNRNTSLVLAACLAVISLLAQTSCERGSPSRVADGTGAPGGTMVSVSVDPNTLLYVQSSQIWWNGNRPDVDRCGAPLDESCAYFISDLPKARACQQHAFDTQKENFRQGYYYVDVPTKPWCKERCKTRVPECHGLGCVGSYLSYAGKKFLELTRSCYETCHNAVRDGAAFPLACRNINSSSVRAELQARYDAVLAQRAQDPEFQKATAEAASAEATLASLRAEENQLQSAEFALKDFSETVYQKSASEIVGRLKTTNDALRSTLVEFAANQKDVVTVISSAHNLIGRTSVSKQEIELLRKELKLRSGVVCRRYDFSSFGKSFDAGMKDLRELNASFLEKVQAVQNPSLLETWKQKLAAFEGALTLIDIPDDVRSGKIASENCLNYQKALVSLAIREQVIDRVVATAEMVAIVKQIDEALRRDEFMEKSSNFKSLILSDAGEIARLINQARMQKRFTQATTLSLDGLRTMYFVMFPAIDLMDGWDAAQKAALKGDLKSLIEKAIMDVDDIVDSMGPGKLIRLRLLGINKSIAALMREISLLSPQEQERWREEWARRTGSVADLMSADGLSVTIPTSDAELSSLFAADASVDTLEKIVGDMQRQVRGGRQ